MFVASLPSRTVKKRDRPLVVLGVLLGAGAATAASYGGLINGASQGVLFTAVMAASTLVGALLGFLFGLPRLSYAAADVQNGTPDGATDANGPIAALGGSASTTRKSQYSPSTNLDDIANWLTKIIVGVGLVEMKSIGGGVVAFAHYIVAPGGTATIAEEGFVAVLVVFSTIGGFLFAYIWTRLNYGAMAAHADVNVLRLIGASESKSMADLGVGGKTTTARVAMASGLPEGGSARAELNELASTDPNKGKFGDSPVGNGRALRATIEPAETKAGMYRVTLWVTNVAGAPPIEGNVTFVLHPTFKQREVSIPVTNGTATLVVIAWGAFTVGATTDNGRTRLELDLAEHPEAPTDFRSR